MDKEQLALQRLRDASMMAQCANMGPPYVLDSGGKDISVPVDLAIKAQVSVEIAHSHTTADAPETVYFVRRELARERDAAGGEAAASCDKQRAMHVWKFCLGILGGWRQALDAIPLQCRRHPVCAGDAAVVEFSISS